MAISVEIVPYSEKEIVIGKAQVSMDGTNDNLEYTIKTPENLRVKIVGFENNLADVTAEDLKPSLNLSDKGIGMHDVDVTFKESEDYTIKDTYKVVVEVKRKE